MILQPLQVFFQGSKWEGYIDCAGGGKEGVGFVGWYEKGFEREEREERGLKQEWRIWSMCSDSGGLVVRGGSARAGHRGIPTGKERNKEERTLFFFF